MAAHLKVSDVACAADVTTDAVRYYEKIGLLRPPVRTSAGYRMYHETTVERLRFIGGAKRVGLRLREIAELLEVMDRGQCPCGHTEAMLRAGIAAELDRELQEHTALRAELVRLVDEHPEGSCPDGTGDLWCRTEFSEGR
jgi:DNA-binding transcriptional MerR regulator